jgi:ATP-dependent Clp protease adaptor protein ClpS
MFKYLCQMAEKMYYSSTGENPLLEEDTGILVDEGNQYVLVVWNDDVNTFDWVIETLVEICGHSPEQAEQCAIIIHTKGKYGVKEGEYQTLKPMCEAICERLINATIEEMVS